MGAVAAGSGFRRGTLRAWDPAQRLGSLRRLFVMWGSLNTLMGSLLAIYPPGWGTVSYLRYTSLASNILFILFAVAVFRLPLRLSASFGLVCLFQVWAVAATILMHAETGRLVQGNAYAHIWLLYFLSLYVATSMFVYAHPGARRVIMWSWALFAVPSGLVGLAQFLGVMPTLGFIQGSGGEGARGFRPSGLTNFPSFLSFQGIIGLSLLVGRLRTRPLTPLEFVGFLFFSGVVVAAQYPTFYLGLGLLWGAAFWFSLRRREQIAWVYVAIAVLAFAVPVVAFPQKFSYAMSTQIQGDRSLDVRREKSWSQLAPIWELRPWTGIGADSNLMITSPDFAVGFDKWSNYVMDSSYRLVLACFGIIGMVIFGVALLVILFFLGRVLADPYEPPERQQMLTALFLVYVSYVVVLYFTNFLVYVQPGVQMALLFALISRTWEEEARAVPDLPFHMQLVSRMRTRQRPGN